MYILVYNFWVRDTNDLMEWDEREWKADEKTFLEVTDIYLIIKCTYWYITFELGIRKH